MNDLSSNTTTRDVTLINQDDILTEDINHLERNNEQQAGKESSSSDSSINSNNSKPDEHIFVKLIKAAINTSIRKTMTKYHIFYWISNNFAYFKNRDDFLKVNKLLLVLLLII
jgi:hypothetical protein